MITLLAKVCVQEGRAAEFELAFTKLAEKVREVESGTQLYKLVRSRSALNTYHFVEFYSSDEALEHHSRNQATKALLSALAEHLAGPAEMTIADDVTWERPPA